MPEVRQQAELPLDVVLVGPSDLLQHTVRLSEQEVLDEPRSALPAAAEPAEHAKTRVEDSPDHCLIIHQSWKRSMKKNAAFGAGDAPIEALRPNTGSARSVL